MSCQQPWRTKLPDPNTLTAAQVAAVAYFLLCTLFELFEFRF